MALGKSLENILGNYFGEAGVNLKAPTGANNKDIFSSKKPEQTKSKKSASYENQKEYDVKADVNIVSKEIVSDKIQNKQTSNGKNFVAVESVNIDLILPSQFQTRTYFDKDKITSLAENIKENGLIQPVVVIAKKSANGTNNYVLLAGERRLRACKLLGWRSILAVIKNENDVDIAHQGLISAMENLQREDLSPIELANTFLMLMKTQKTDEQGIANMIEKTVQHIRNYLRLLTLHPQVQEFLNMKKLGEGQVRHIVGLDPEMQFKIALITIEKQLTVKEVARLVENMFNPKNTENMPLRVKGYDLPQEYIQESIKFSRAIPKSSVKYFGTKEKGKIVIAWGN